MVHRAVRLKYQVLTSELEALLVEAELIRLHQPEYNVLLKDDKTPLYIHITDDAFPKVTTLRKKELLTQQHKGTTLGPFPSGYKAKEVLKLIRPIFPWCNQRGSNEASSKPCFYHHIDLCPGACIGLTNSDEYGENINQLTAFLKGKKSSVVRDLTQKMKAAAQKEAFEAAAKYKHMIELIESVTKPSVILKPQLSLPQLKDSKIEESVLQLQKILSTYLHIPTSFPLRRIEGYDVSNTQGTNASVAMVTFISGTSEPSEYRLFNIRTLNTPNDYHMMKEALLRRQNHPEWGEPSLLVIDGGKGQLRAALSVWNWSTPVISIAKNPDRLILPNPQYDQSPKSGSTKYHVVKLEPSHPALQLVQQVRDEAHRFSKKQHLRRQTRALFE